MRRGPLLAVVMVTMTLVTAGATVAIESEAAPASTRRTYTCGGDTGRAIDHPRNRQGATRLGSNPVTYCPVSASTPISQEFGTVSSSSPYGHSGLDFNGETGDPVFSASGGTVTFAGWNSGGYGNMIVIERPDGIQFIYAHLSRIRVHEGVRLRAGRLIGLMGNTGASEGSHLHFEVAASTGARGGYGTPTNPRDLLWGRPEGRHVGTATRPPRWSCDHYGGC